VNKYSLPTASDKVWAPCVSPVDYRPEMTCRACVDDTALDALWCSQWVAIQWHLVLGVCGMEVHGQLGTWSGPRLPLTTGHLLHEH